MTHARLSAVLVLVDGAAGRGVRLAELLVLRTVEFLLEDGLGLVDLELGLEVVDVSGQAAAVGAAPGIGEVEALVDGFLTRLTPVGLSTTVLLDLLGISVCEAVFGEILGDVVLGASSAVGKSGVVAVVQLVRSGHVDGFGDARRFQSKIRVLMDFRGSRVLCLSDGFDSTIVLQGGRLSLGLLTR